MNSSLASILVVDDDADISMMLKMMLEYKGYRVFTAARAEDILTIISQQKVRLIIMDMLLSGINGTDICAQLKTEESKRHIPILMISAHPNAKELCMNAGANNFISKPFDINDLIQGINNELMETPGFN